MSLTKFLAILVIVSAITAGLSSCDWSGSGTGQGSSHYSGITQH